MIKEDEIQDFFKNIKFRAMFDEMNHLDAIFYNQEVKIKKLEESNKKLHADYIKMLNEKMANDNSMISDSLKAMIDYPSDIKNIGIVGAAVLVRIQEMKTIKEVHEYVIEIGKRAIPKDTKKNANNKKNIN